jgi:hypothetical protein
VAFGHTVEALAIRRNCPTTGADTAEMEKYPFRSAISSLMFALMTMRVDISFPMISSLPTMACPIESLWSESSDTADLKLTYRKMTSDPAPLMYD